MEAGFDMQSVNYIDNLFPSYQNEIYQQIQKNQLVKRYLMMLDMADAISMGFSITQSKKNMTGYKRWQNKIKREITKLNGTKDDRPSFWDTNTKSRRF